MSDDIQTAPTDEPSPEAPDAADEIRRERDEYHDLLLRKTAELDNYRKRVDRERRDLEQAVGAELIMDLLPLVDNLERAIGADPEGATAGSYREGVELIHRQLLDLLDRRGVVPFDSVGEDFDPELHDAVAAEPAEGRRDGEVIDELRRGYRRHGRLLRPAMVRVAKA